MKRIWYLRSLAAAGVVVLVMCAIGDQETGNVVVQILDGATGQPTPARVRLVDAGGSPAGMPVDAIATIYGSNDRYQGDVFQPDSAFYADGRFSMTARPGAYTLGITKGIEYVPVTESVSVTNGQRFERTVTLNRWIDMPARSWYSGDDHIHLRRSSDANRLILRWIAAEDIHLGNILRMGDARRTYFEQYAFGKMGRYVENDYALAPGQENPRTGEIGHTISLNLTEAVHDSMQYYLYDRVFDAAHAQGGMTGYAHQALSFNGYRGMSIDVPRGKVDFLELLQHCVPGGPLLPRVYYRFLDMGYKLTAMAGSDFPWCGARIGNARVYTHLAGPFSVDAWMDQTRAGHTFVTNGPMLDFTVNGAQPGDEVNTAPGSTVRVHATATSHPQLYPLASLSIVGHSRILARSEEVRLDGALQSITIELELPVKEGLWLAAVCSTAAEQFAHTTPVYVRVNGGPTWSRERLPACLAETEVDLKEVDALIRGDSEDAKQKRLSINANRHNTPEWAVVDNSEGRIGRLGVELQKRVEDSRAALRALAKAAGVRYPK